jgi:hypothetical protein
MRLLSRQGFGENIETAAIEYKNTIEKWILLYPIFCKILRTETIKNFMNIIKVFG